jgi:hypothetical protein
MGGVRRIAEKGDKEETVESFDGCCERGESVRGGFCEENEEGRGN